MATLRRRRRCRGFSHDHHQLLKTLVSAVALLLLLLPASAAARTKLLSSEGVSHQRELYPSDQRVASRSRRGLLVGPGSWPPSCRTKCGNCAPCQPVHVPVQPGLSTPLEYYPEAWRCKCGGKLFMP